MLELLPVAALLACPLMMGAMMWMMRGQEPSPPGADDEQRELAALRAEIEQLRVDRSPSAGVTGSGVGPVLGAGGDEPGGAADPHPGRPRRTASGHRLG